MKNKVLLDPYSRQLTTIFTDEDLARLHAVADLLWARDELAPDAVVEQHAAELTVIICGSWHYGDVARFPKLRAVLEVSGGFPTPQRLDYAACFARQIRVLSCAPAFGPAVAEMGLGLALACARQIAWTDAAFRYSEPNWSHREFATVIGDTFTLYGKSVGLIGFGSLARCLKSLLVPFGCSLQAYDPWLTDTSLREQGVAPVDLHTLLATSRVIFVLAVPSTSNRALLGHEQLTLIRPDTVFVLLSRSHVVDFDALTALLLAGRFRAAIDVFPEEPLPADHPIRRAQHAVLSSHRAGAMGEALHMVGRFVADDLEAICAGLVPQRMQVAQPEYIQLRG
ncbi:MAG: hydroxyacid dehydrogenase [Herpetosiphonaceae bacterium]|nr:hydroxyacid dehydrogenase [Herpetosiphonaceae bacterium]